MYLCVIYIYNILELNQLSRENYLYHSLFITHKYTVISFSRKNNIGFHLKGVNNLPPYVLPLLFLYVRLWNSYLYIRTYTRVAMHMGLFVFYIGLLELSLYRTNCNVYQRLCLPTVNLGLFKPLAKF